MKHLKELLTSLLIRRRANQEEKLAHRVVHELQVNEFHGELYIAFRGHPIVPAKDLNGDIVETLSRGRQFLIKFYEEEEYFG